MVVPSEDRSHLQREVPSADAVARFTFELGQLREEARHGMIRIGENPESVADHTHRACVIGFLIAHQEGLSDPNLVVSMITFHDMHEARIGDLDMVAKKYLTVDKQALIEAQTSDLGMVGETIRQLWQEVETGSSDAGIIAKDADLLELLFTAREVEFRGNADASLWIENNEPRLKTESGKALFAAMREADPHEWWKRVCQ